MALVRVKVPFVTYVGEEAVNGQPGQTIRVPKRTADALVKADLAEYEVVVHVTENKSEGPAPEVKVAQKRTTAKRAQAQPKPE